MLFKFIVTFFLFIFLKSSNELQELKIGGLFSDPIEKIAYQRTLKLMNEEYIGPFFQYNVTSHCFNVSDTNTFKAYIDTCNLLEKGIIGLFGPSSSYSSSYIQSICDRKEIPHVEIHSDPKLDRRYCSVNLHPHPTVLANVYLDLVKAFGWHKMIILYEKYESLSSISNLLELNVSHQKNVLIRKLETDINGSYHISLMNAKKTGETNFIIECSINVLDSVLKQAQQVGMMTDNYHFIIANLDMHTIDISPYQYAGTNITGLRIVNPNSPDVIRHTKEIQKLIIPSTNFNENFQGIKLRLRTALTIDSVRLFYETVHDLLSAGIINLNTQPMYCNTTDSWHNGYTIINYMKRRVFDGLTGELRFDYEGFRRDFKLDIMELSVEGLIKIGDWNSTSRQIVTKHLNRAEPLLTERNLFNKTFFIITCLTAPYAMLKETTTQLIGNDRFEGFGIDVIDKLSKLLGFNYTIIIQPDGQYGNFNRTSNEWNGMIKEIIEDRADFGIVDLTITSERENGVDFTMPFMNLGICILYRKPEPVPPSLFMFASPFSLSVWLMLGVAYFLVSFAIFVIGRLSPSEWVNPYPCVEEPEFLINQFSIRNCLWFTVGALMQQGSELEPKSISTRTASGVWWFFTLIMVSSYTANLAAFLTVETLVTSFKNIEELSRQTEIKYGAKRDGATANFFRDSNISTYQKIWRHMALHPEDMVNSNDEGVAKVEKENYAYLMESTSIEYETERHCSLAQVGNLLDDKGYGIAMKKFSEYRNEMSREVLKLQETGELSQLKIKWWKEKRGGGKCASKSEGGDATPLDLKNVGGVFLVLFVGSIMGLIGSFLEMAYQVWQECKEKKRCFKEDLIRNLKFVVHFKQNIKELSYDDDDNEVSEANLLESIKS
ncbi:unnamed protein product [Brassicogethes aeneus]|uniref:Uncharacterized protein n=1 Tax=Brassicogethes aeneus TaxID=1431903 RepID=A0A9P0FEQ0_BRAAE|nr:unnamed protein product [Brassicogethes aeneus]